MPPAPETGPTDPERITAMLDAAARGEASAVSNLLDALYRELRALAASHLARTPPGNTLQPTALVHEAYVKLARGGEGLRFEGRAHFFGAASRAMRDILVDQARRKAAAKHGGALKRAPASALDDAPDLAAAREDLPEIDAALRKLEAELPRKAEVVLLRYFTGLSIEQVAEVLGVTARTVNRDWLFAKAWLQRELENARRVSGAGDA
jgi:RNA polymerase sigma factor (TIGR02999 family)